MLSKKINEQRLRRVYFASLIKIRQKVRIIERKVSYVKKKNSDDGERGDKGELSCRKKKENHAKKRKKERRIIVEKKKRKRIEWFILSFLLWSRLDLKQNTTRII